MKIKELEPQQGYESLHYCEDEASGLRSLISIHSTLHGPAAGGCRFFDYETLNHAIIDAQRLAKGMTYKNRAANLPLGGGKSVILGKHKTPEMMRAFGRFVDSFDGRYYTAEDVGVSTKDMQFAAENSKYVAGLEIGDFASGDPSPVTAEGVFICLKHAVNVHLGRSELTGLKVAVQGLGHVGWYVAKFLHEAGANLFVTDIDPLRVTKAEKAFSAQGVAPEDIYRQDVDVFAPCAMGSVLNPQTIKQLKATVVAGAANNQLSAPNMGDVLQRMNVFYAPDYVVNAGGIVNASMEILKISDPSFAKSRMQELTATMDKIIALSKQQDIGLHTAADRYVEAQLVAA